MSREEAGELLGKSPEPFTASVVLRPLLQDHLLPTIAPVGGPTEISNFAQLTGLYEWLERPLPGLVPRASFTVVSNKPQTILSKYGLNFSDAFVGKERTASRVVEQYRIRSNGDRVRMNGERDHFGGRKRTSPVKRVRSSRGDLRVFLSWSRPQ